MAEKGVYIVFGSESLRKCQIFYRGGYIEIEQLKESISSRGDWSVIDTGEIRDRTKTPNISDLLEEAGTNLQNRLRLKEILSRIRSSLSNGHNST